MTCADRITVLQRAASPGRIARVDATEQQIVRMIMGRRMRIR